MKDSVPYLSVLTSLINFTINHKRHGDKVNTGEGYAIPLEDDGRKIGQQGEQLRQRGRRNVRAHGEKGQ